MSVKIDVNQVTRINEEGLYEITLTALDTTTGIDKNIFVFEQQAGKPPEFHHVASVQDYQKFGPVLVAGTIYYRAASVTVSRDNAFDAQKLLAEFKSHIIALEKNASVIENTFNTDIDLSFENGEYTNVT